MPGSLTNSLCTVVLALLCSAARSQPPVHAFYGTATGDNLGMAVSGAGDVNGDGYDDLIVGAPMDDTAGAEAGSARVLSGSDGSALYTLFGDDAGDRFGSSVSAAGDVNGDGFADVIVGAPGDDNNGSDSGSARVFSGSDGSVLYTFDGDDAGDELGRSVSGSSDIDGDGYDDVIAGAPGDDNNGSDSGSARVFAGVDGSVVYTFDGDGADDSFGQSVAGTRDLDGDGRDDLLVGAPLDDDGGTDAGRVFAISGADGSTLWTSDGDGDGDQCGWSVAGAGDVNGDGFADAIAGAPMDDGVGADSGSVRVLSGPDGTTLYSYDGSAAGDNLGWAVAGAGDVNGDGMADLIAGAPLHDGSSGDSGCARVWSGADGSRLLSIDGAAGQDQLGMSVGGAADVDGDGYADVIVGVPNDDTQAPDAGSALVFARKPWDVMVDAATINSASANALFGRTTAAVGDVDMDGVLDYGVGAAWDVGTLGTVRVYSGADNSLLYTWFGPALDSYFGVSLGPAGDLDQDGFDDVIVGAQHDDTINVDSGMAQVFSGATGTLIRTYLGPGFRSHLGTAVGGLGDVDGDGVDDVWLGMGIHNSEAGAVRVVSGADSSIIYEVPGGRPFGWFSWSGATVGDVDGDGIDDMVMGSPAASAVPPIAGRATVLSGADGSTIHVFEGLAAGDRFGWACSPAGDVNADGVPDIIVGADRYDVGSLIDAGFARVYSGADGAMLYHIDGEADGDTFGQSVGTVGDANGDGFDDFVVGAPHADVGMIVKPGSVFVYSGRDGSLLQRLDGDTDFDGFGWHVAGMGDLTGDGYGELLVAVPYDDDPEFDAGTVRVFESRVQTDPGAFRTYGAACQGSNGNLPAIGINGRPVVGQSFGPTLGTAAPTTPAILGFDIMPQAIPMDISGAPGCTLLALPLLTVNLMTDAMGRASFSIVIPTTAPVGAILYAQWYIIDPPASQLGLVMSNGGALTLGQ